MKSSSSAEGLVSVAALLALGLALGLSGCVREVQLLEQPLDADRATYCAGQGSPVVASNVSSAPECGNDFASTAFRYALCICGSAGFQGALTVDSFDSSEGPFSEAEPGGSVGLNGRYYNTRLASIGGSLVSAGSSAALTGETHVIGGDLRLDAGFMVDGPTTVEGNAFVNGTVDASSAFTVAGDLFLSPGSGALDDVRVSGTIHRAASFEVAPPCGCDPNTVPDIASIVTDGALSHQNEEVGLDSAQLSGAGADVDLELPCGRFYFDSIDTLSRSIRLRVTGRTLLYVGGDVTLTNPMTLDVGPDGELDVFIAGNLEATTALQLGDAAGRPSSVRLWVGGSEPIVMGSGSTLAANLYAPHAPLRPAGGTMIFGAAFVGSFSSSGGHTIHFDRSSSTCPVEGDPYGGVDL